MPIFLSFKVLHSVQSYISNQLLTVQTKSTMFTLYIHLFYFSYISNRPTYCQLKSTTRTNCCIYTVYLLMMGYKYTRNM